MTYEQIEKNAEKFEKHIDSFYGDGIGYFTSGAKTIHVADAHKNFLKQSFIKYLQSEVERLDGTKQGEIIYIECPHAFDCGGCMDKTDKDAVAYNQAISDQITHLQAQIKNIEEV